MRTNQGIFRAVIKAGIYKGARCSESVERFMCHSLVEARKTKVITAREYDLATGAIKKYFNRLNCMTGGSYSIMEHATRYAFPVSHPGWEGMLDFYKNWNKRP
jgi:hypothetical protein